ncbi:MAG TPA: antibiotic biosynthesis monooxygenase [Candidatus Angelobacter sp.]|nr:antibiotic biosynthesis monooxygenase [Candidatus Angelobacter sp.]
MRPAVEAELVEKYGSIGVWARFFRSSEGYIRTELVKDAVAQRFLTLDYWKSEEAFHDFHKQNQAEYQRLDKELEGLTQEETRLGAFWTSKG